MLSNKTPKLDRSDGVKEMKDKAPKRKLPFTAGANGDQKDSDSGKLGCLLLSEQLRDGRLLNGCPRQFIYA